MLKITIPASEQWDESKQEFISTKETTLQLEHSLVSVAKWESKWQKPFLSKTEKSIEETIDYIRCMTLTQNVDPKIYYLIPSDAYVQINKYIESPQSATTFREDHAARGSREIITSEVIYYWMVALNIPFECQKWHLNRLLNLVKICNIKNQPSKKMSGRELMSQNAALNAARRKQFNTKG